MARRTINSFKAVTLAVLFIVMVAASLGALKIAFV